MKAIKTITCIGLSSLMLVSCSAKEATKDKGQSVNTSSKPKVLNRIVTKPKVELEIVKEPRELPMATDIEGHKYQTSIKKFLNKVHIELENGNSFNPDKPITRAEFVDWLFHYKDLPGFKTERPPYPTFPDVSPKHKYYPEIEALAGAVAIVGHEDGTFAPDDNLTREQMALIYAAFGNNVFLDSNFMGKDPEDTRGAILYDDRNSVGKYYVVGVFIANPWLTSIYPGAELTPQTAVTRAEAVKFLIDSL